MKARLYVFSRLQYADANDATLYDTRLTFDAHEVDANNGRLADTLKVIEAAADAIGGGGVGVVLEL